ncbi:DNA-3-methyladenine glycosylase family protein [Pseudomarimonas arenosa]|uniref:DNA-3-methyladenine glycosylase II n=1 Tax=Pseudomarimonas arenosa TaxID=2774145 RepID=A0AAW3ZIZ2_9GAMM|nr:DNA-3-methyladenine glycosylase 2 family protein [Pseudomarimonas arenosa]MBD8524684.1 DNA-3-methyladenine glycosylase 2 family protein [Pseudomarimonas arenosa]
MPVMKIERGFDIAMAARALRRNDPQLGRWMRKIGALPRDPRWTQSFDLVDALARAILYQQLSGKAAATIVGRVETAIGRAKLCAKGLAKVDDPTVRACGVSANKLLALRDLARHADQGLIPSARQLDRLTDQEIVDRLTAVRGIGRWTVEMLLMFRLGRADVFAMDDLGLRKGIQRLDELEQMPTAKQAAERAKRWAPHRTLASLYLWRVADFQG